MQPQIKMANMELDIAVDMELDNVVDKVVDMVADMVVPMMADIMPAYHVSFASLFKCNTTTEVCN